MSGAVEIRDYQERALAAIETTRAAGKHAALIVQPTGTGKTITFSELVRRWRLPTLILAHREELLTQARDKLQLLWPEVDVGIVGGGYDESGHQVTIASVQAVSRPKRLAYLARAGIGLMVIDEAHHSPAATYRRVIEACHAGEPGGAFLLGVTATPDRTDGKMLDALYGEPAFVVSLPAMVRDGYLCDLRGLQVRTETDLDAVKTRMGDFAEDQLAAAVNTQLRNEQIVEAYHLHAPDRLALAFAASVKHAYDLAESFREQGVSAVALDGETPRDLRQQILSDYAAGRVRVVCNVGVLTEGFDAPETACVILARPTQSRSLYVQMVGRGTRQAPGKRDCLVLDIADNTTRHSLISLPTLIGRKGYVDDATIGADDGGINENEDDEQATERAPTQERLFSLRDELCADLGPSGRVVIRDVDLLGRSFAWQPLGDGNYRLTLTGRRETFWLVLHDAGYVAGIVWPDGYRQRLTSQPATLDWAQLLAEQAAAQVRDGRGHFLDDRAPWRSQPATASQLAKLRHLHVRVPREGLTRGAASELIGAALAAPAAPARKDVS